jgi:hypothetical protein
LMITDHAKDPVNEIIDIGIIPAERSVSIRKNYPLGSGNLEPFKSSLQARFPNGR